MKLNITTKINLLSGFLIITLTIFLGWFFVRHTTKVINTELEGRANAITSNLAYNSEFGILVGDIEALTRLLDGVIKEKDIAYARIEDKEGKIISQVGEKKEPIREFRVDIVTKLLPEAQEELGFITERKEELIGRVQLGVSLLGLYRKTAQVKKVVFSVVIIAILISSLGFLIGINFLITRPLMPLISGIERIGRGDLSHRVDVKAQDEIGDLANSFNKMAGDLKKSRDNLIKAKDKEIELQKTAAAEKAKVEAVEESKKEIEKKNEELQTSNEKLQQTTKELLQAQAQLIRSEKLAVIGKLASGVGHELRTPLSSIKNVAFYLSRYANIEDPEAKEYLDTLLKEVNVTEEIISDLLDFSRQTKLNKINLSIKEIIKDSLKSLNLGDDIKVNVDVSPEANKINADMVKLKQVFQNLLKNASQAMPDGGEIKIVTNKEDNQIKITIEDTGEGMDEETKGHIFEPLFTTKAKGIGLGMSIVKDIIDHHDGNIQVESKKGEGTKFTITFLEE